MRYYLAIDIGASSGRHIISYLENGKMITEEIYRFQNQENDSKIACARTVHDELAPTGRFDQARTHRTRNDDARATLI